MIRIFKLVVLLVISQVAFGQAPSNYTNINGRYRWIAGMFDSTFHIPKGSTPSLRTGGSTNSGGLFYNTSDSSVYTYTGTQWIKLRGSINPSDTTNKYVTQVYKKSGSDSIFYVKGGNHLFAFVDSVGSPGGGGGGKVYYFNGGVNMGTIGGLQMYELGDTANTGAAANFTRSTTGNIANFITDPGKPGLLQIPAGVWSVDAWLSETGGGANHAEIWIEVEKWDGSTITTIATSPIEQITEGATPNLYSWSVSIPTTSLTVTDRIIIQFYISNTNGKTVTLYTQNGYVGEVHTTFTTGIGAINGLTTPAQYLVTGTSGTDFNINSSTATHTFNLPTASATNRGALSSTDWSTFNSKIGPSDTASMLANYITGPQNQSGYMARFNGGGTIDTSRIFQNNGLVGINTTGPSYSLDVLGTGRITSNTYLATSSGVVGIGTTSADSLLTVQTGAWVKRGLRLSGLPTGTGTKSLRVDANGTVSLADTLANGISGTGTTNYIPKFTSSSAIGNSIVQDLGTGISVGGTTTSNGYINNQASSVSSSGGMFRLSNGYTYFVGSSTGNGSILGNGDGTATIQALSPAGNNGYLVFETGAGSERMRLDASGNLGLGTSSPTSKLDVQGAISLGAVSLPSAGVARLYSRNTDNNLYIQTSTGNNFYLLDGSQNSMYTVSPTSHLWLISNSTRMTLDASGNLGLSVTPSAWLSTNRAFQLGYGAIRSFTNSANVYLENNNYVNTSGTDIYLNNGAAGRYRIADEQHIWYQAASGTAGNAISFTQAMTLDASGRLGIGTTNPKLGLHVNSGASSSPATSGTTPNGIAVFQPNDGSNAIIMGAYGTAPYGNWIQSQSTSGLGTTFPLILQPIGGNVGIGTTSPTSIFHVNTSSQLRARFYSSGAASFLDIENAGGSFYVGKDNGSGTDFGVGAYSSVIWSVGAYPLVFSVNNTERMRITSGGELLINTTSDAGDYKLQVNGNGLFTGVITANSGTTDTPSLLIYGNTNGGVRQRFLNQASSGLYNWQIGTSLTATNLFEIQASTAVDGTTFTTSALKINTSGNGEFGGSIKTAAPSGGTAAAWKLGERVASAGVTFNDQQYIQLDIGGTLYYLATVDLPMPEAYPQATSGPSNNYKMAPVQVKTTRDAEIEKLRKEIEELKQLIKNK